MSYLEEGYDQLLHFQSGSLAAQLGVLGEGSGESIGSIVADPSKLGSSSSNMIANPTTDQVRSTNILGGDLIDGIILGKEAFIKGGVEDYLDGEGIFLGWHETTYKFFVGDSAGDYISWDGTTLTIGGSFTDGTIAGMTITATALTATSGGNTTILSSGTTAFSAGPTGFPTATITQAGAATFTSVTLSTSVNLSGLVPGSDIAIQGWQLTSVFTATNFQTVAWTSGTLTVQDGTTYSISGSNTGSMSISTINYIYFNPAVSTTAFQVTTTAANAVGANKILIATAAPIFISGRSATFTVFGGATSNQGVSVDGGTQIAGASITATQIANATITGAKIANATIAAANIVSATITSTQIASATITGGNIASGTITATNITAATITATEIANATITGGKIASATITGSNIASGTITATNIQAATITATQIASATITGSLIAAATITGSNIASATITATNIAAATITGTEIASATITGSNIGSATITGSNIANTTIAAGNIISGTITTTQIASGTITGSNIASGTIIGSNIASTTITATNITALTITAAEIANLTINGAKVASGAITPIKTTMPLFMVSGGTFNDDTPDTDSVSWTSVTIQYNGTEYTITNSNTNARYIVWDSASPTAISGSATVPTSDTVWLLGMNNTGTFLKTWDMPQIHGEQIQAATITGSQIASATITASNITAATITATQIANGTITGTQIAAATISGSNIASGTITSANIENATITGADIASATITSANIANATITTTQISATAGITGTQIANTTITASNIVNATITGTQIATGTITATNITALTITAAEIANLTISTGKIADLAITNAKINDLAVSKLTAGTITSKSIVLAVSDGTGDVEIRSGIAAGDFANAGAASGFIWGVDDSDSNKAKFYVGDATSNMYWNGSTLSITGSFSVSSGSTIAGFDIGTDYIRDVANSFGMASTVTGGDDVRFWAGDTFANRATAPFRVTEAGDVTATNVSVSGTITPTESFTAGEDITANKAVYVKASDGKVYHTDAGFDTEKLFSFIGFAAETKTTGNAVKIQSSLAMSGFSGLIAGTKYNLAKAGTSAQTQTGGNSGTGTSVTIGTLNEGLYARKFTTTERGLFKSFTLRVHKSGTPTNSILCQVRTGTPSGSTIPFGSLLATSDAVTAASFSSGDNVVFEFTDFVLGAGTYHIEVYEDVADGAGSFSVKSDATTTDVYEVVGGSWTNGNNPVDTPYTITFDSSTFTAGDISYWYYDYAQEVGTALTTTSFRIFKEKTLGSWNTIALTSGVATGIADRDGIFYYSIDGGSTSGNITMQSPIGTTRVTSYSQSGPISASTASMFVRKYDSWRVSGPSSGTTCRFIPFN